jgi:hypothetical protein
MKKLFGFLLIFFVLALNNGYCGTIDPNVDDEKYVAYGSRFEHTVKIVCDDGKGYSSGSAVIIDDFWVLTAAHVVKGMKNHYIVVDGKKKPLDKVKVHEKYHDNVFGLYDIALGHIKDGVDLEPYPALYTDKDEVGKMAAIAGLGLTGNFNTGVKIADNKKRAGSNYIEKAERGVLICTASRPNQKHTELEYLICSGDSGGGLFINGKLAGINSSVLGYDGKPDSTYGDESCHTRISLYSDWIKKNKK